MFSTPNCTVSSPGKTIFHYILQQVMRLNHLHSGPFVLACGCISQSSCVTNLIVIFCICNESNRVHASFLFSTIVSWYQNSFLTINLCCLNRWFKHHLCCSISRRKIGQVAAVIRSLFIICYIVTPLPSCHKYLSSTCTHVTVCASSHVCTIPKNCSNITSRLNSPLTTPYSPISKGVTVFWHLY